MGKNNANFNARSGIGAYILAMIKSHSLCDTSGKRGKNEY